MHVFYHIMQNTIYLFVNIWLPSKLLNPAQKHYNILYIKKNQTYLTDYLAF